MLDLCACIYFNFKVCDELNYKLSQRYLNHCIVDANFAFGAHSSPDTENRFCFERVIVMYIVFTSLFGICVVCILFLNDTVYLYNSHVCYGIIMSFKNAYYNFICGLIYICKAQVL